MSEPLDHQAASEVTKAIMHKPRRTHGDNILDSLPGRAPVNPHAPTQGPDEFNGTDLEIEWFENAFRCRLGLVYDADELRRCWQALGRKEVPSLSDGQLAFQIVKSFLCFRQ